MSDYGMAHGSYVRAIQPRPEPQQPFTVRLPPTEVDALDELARSAGCLRSDLVRQALRAGLDVLTTDQGDAMTTDESQR